MGFTSTRIDPNLLMKPLSTHLEYDYISTSVDNFIIVTKQHLLYLEMLASKFNPRNITDSPKFF